jgi:hypothetical protein
MIASSVILAAVVVASAAVPQEADQKLQKDVADAREKAIKYLKAQQTAQGHWEGLVLAYLADMDGGSTALVVLGLLEAGVPADDPAVKKALEYLEKLSPKRTYVVSLQTQVFAKADAKKYAEPIQKNADWLIDTALGFKKDGKLEGWSYPGNTVSDNSNTHFAVFGLHAAANAGAKVDQKLWPAIRRYYLHNQRERGWTYHNAQVGDTAPSRSMTSAALVGLAVVDKYDKATDASKEAFEKGMKAFLAFPDFNPKSTGYQTLVIAELGRVTGSPTFKAGDKTVAWYREGAAKLVKEQQPDGSWVFGKGIDGAAVLTTAFGLYFLGPPEKK